MILFLVTQKTISRCQEKMSLSDSDLLDQVNSAITNVLLGKDVMFDGHRVTLDGIDTLFKIREKLTKKTNAAAGRGMTKNNVGIMKR